MHIPCPKACQPSVPTLLSLPCLLLLVALDALAQTPPPLSNPAQAQIVEADICIYGGTSGGVVAAVQAARLGKTAVIVEPGKHLGGMTSGGLSWTDVGSSDRVQAVSGMAREVYERIGAHYGQRPGTAFDEPTKAEQLQRGVDFAKPPSLAFEPKVAEAVFTELAAEAQVRVYFEQPLQSVRKTGPRIQELITADGTIFRAKVFLDATYEGDLLAKAGVTYTVGRESNAQYGETVNGIQKPATNPRAGKFEVPIDPYRTPGDPTSGVLPYLLRDEPLGEIGAADSRVQSYNFRACLTDNPRNRIPLTRPSGYDPANYELLARWIAARQAAGQKLTLRDFLKYDPLQNDKYDFNNRWPISTDFLGGADAYPEANAATRQQIAQAHEQYLRGFFYFFAHDPRVPEAVRQEMSRFGLCQDEFTGTHGWPHQMYVREARRMVSDFVMIEPHCRGAKLAPRSIALGAYGVDMHAVRRIVHGGQPVNEGSNGVSVPRPYPISYGAIVPKADQCDNLYVTFALSASHVAFGSIRMEPVFMALSQSAAQAASIAIDRGLAVQQVPYDELRQNLLASRLALEWPVKSPPKSSALIKPAPTATPHDLDGQSFDLVVVGATPGGIACAVRAARQGLSVLLVHHHQHVGGFITSGAGGWEAPYDGLRSPLYAEIRTGASDYYRQAYGADSQQYRASLPNPHTNSHLDRAKVEPRVAEMLFERMLAQESNLKLLRNFHVTLTHRDGAQLKSLTLRAKDNDTTIRVAARAFADGTYEGDLIAAAKVPCRVGREARGEYQEPHAGVIYATERRKPPGQKGFPADADRGILKIRYNSHATAELVQPQSTGEADSSVMAYNYRLILTRDPANRVMVEKPPGYRLDIVRSTAGGGFVPNLPNDKVAWNGGRLIGPQNDYPEASWQRREQISQQYLSAMLMLLWYYQHDPAASPADRAKYQDYGLAADEFIDNNHLPYEIYVREARRLVGRYVFTEHDNLIAAGIGRTPIHSDSVAITDWPVDSVACLKRKTPGGNYDGIFFLAEQSRPAQVPYRCLLAKELDNLLAVVPLSASHVGWGSIRLEPVWMQTGEAAGFAIALAQQQGISPAALNPQLLTHTLASHQHMISFFNDVDVASNNPDVVAAQFFGTQGFLPNYNARLDKPLTTSTARLWGQGFNDLLANKLQPAELAAALAQAEAGDAAHQDTPIAAAEFLSLLPKVTTAQPSGLLTRGQALRLLFSRLPIPRLEK